MKISLLIMSRFNCIQILILFLLIGSLANIVNSLEVTCQSNSLPAPFVNSNGQCECIRGYKWNGQKCLLEVQDDTTLDPVHLATEVTTQTSTPTKVTTEAPTQVTSKANKTETPTQATTKITTKVPILTTKATTHTSTHETTTQTPAQTTSNVTTQVTIQISTQTTVATTAPTGPPTQSTTRVMTQNPTKATTQVQTTLATIQPVATTVTTEPTQAPTQTTTKQPPPTTTKIPTTKSRDPVMQSVLGTIARAEKDLQTLHPTELNKVHIETELKALKNLISSYELGGGEVLIIQISIHESRLKHYLDRIEHHFK